MKSLLRELYVYLRSLRLLPTVGIVALAAILVWINYRFGLERRLMRVPVLPRLAAWWMLFVLAFGIPYRLLRPPLLRLRNFRLLLALAALLFSLKLALPFPFRISTDEMSAQYWQRVLYYPYKLLLTTGLLWLVWRRFDADKPFYGASRPERSLQPYLLMLAVMTPLVALAATQPDFRALYPKWMHIAAIRKSSLPGKLLYELAYGSDFITIELFFRGFLVAAFARFAGRDAILPMAVFYCTIHFGKPLGECISSFFGGVLLGVVSYHTRSIRGGLLVHLGIAWLMELAGWAGHQFAG